MRALAIVSLLLVAVGAVLWFGGSREPARIAGLQAPEVDTEEPTAELERPTHVSRPAQGDRAVVDTAAATASGERPPLDELVQTAVSRTDVATLAVRVVSGATGRPVGGVALQLMAPGAAPVHGRSDANGGWVRSVAAEKLLQLRAVAVHGKNESTGILVEPIPTGERRDVTLEVATLFEAFHGLVLADEDGRPLEGVQVLGPPKTIHRRSMTSHTRAFEDWKHLETTDDVGMFHVSTQGEPELACALLFEGRAPLLVTLDASDASELRPREVRLVRAARLSGQVDGLGPESGTVRLTTPSFHLQSDPHSAPFIVLDLVWEAETTAEGSFRFEDLPVGVPLGASVWNGGLQLHEEAAPLVLESGIETRVHWELHSGARVEGLVLNERGEPMPDTEVWLVAPGGPERRMFSTTEEWKESRRSDERGAFVFEEVPPGTWDVGAAPHVLSQRARVMQPLHIGMPERVTIPVGVRLVEVTVRLRPGGFIHGKVLGDGAPVAEARIAASAMEVGDYCRGITDAAGGFELGPLLPGEYRIAASGPSGSGLAPAETVVASTGADDVVLVLTRGGALRGRIVGGRESAFEGKWIVLSSVGRRSSSGQLDAGGRSFHVDGLSPGRHAAFVRGKWGWIAAASGIEVEAGTETEVILQAQEAATLLVRGSPVAPGAEDVLVWVELEGIPLPKKLLRTESTSMVVPPGTFELHARRRVVSPSGQPVPTPEHVQVVSIGAGQTKELTLILD